jgi:hypothetical protein
MRKPYEKPTAHELTREGLAAEERELLKTLCKKLLQEHSHKLCEEIGNEKDHQKFIQLVKDFLEILRRQAAKPDAA